MKNYFKTIPGTITAPSGFRAAGVFCDIKRVGTGKGSEKGVKRDLGLLVSEAPATVAGLFTTNQVCAAPVKVSVARVRQGVAQAVVANSGNANACTGAAGRRDAETMTAVAGRYLHFEAKQVLVCSTGRIGMRLPMDHVSRGIQAAASLLDTSSESGHHFAEAIMTTDTCRKEIAVEFTLSGKRVRLAGVSKGAGMIQPGMSPTGKRPAVVPRHATMLCFLTTDAAIAAPALQAALTEAVAHSFNRITVDGDMSTNDSVIALANSLAGNRVITLRNRRSADYTCFQAALKHVTLELAKMMVRDGEGVSRFITLRVSGAVTPADADVAARAVANSALVKTSWCGGDPNWGRIIDALGYSAAKVAEEKVAIGYSLPNSRKILFAVRHGELSRTPLAALRKIVGQKEFEVHVNLNLGSGGAVIYTGDLTEAYVDLNKGE